MKKKLRKIVVQDRIFWWKADWFYHPDGSRILRVQIWGEEKKNRPLFVNLTSKVVEYLVYQTYPKPKDIAQIITYALAHGWNPFSTGAAYWLKEESNGLELADLLVTDVGRTSQASGPLSRKRE